MVERLLAAGARIDIQNLEEPTPEQMVYEPGAYSRQWGITVKQKPPQGTRLVPFGGFKMTPAQGEIQDLFDRARRPADSPTSPDAANPEKR